ncbi:MAG TPA: NAD(P)H-dependent glycerol-3-phosphate dehydrogenase, partial [Chthonomonadaceae bacterium]|nr:NAD(P)H-dependent glycerol-3-phosphate dehydrogenase [Chthonomonadaceae bacterium]
MTGEPSEVAAEMPAFDQIEGRARIAVLGAGSWGTALAALLAANGHVVRLWGRDRVLVRALEERRENARYLPGIPLPPGVFPTADLEEALEGAQVAVLAVPSSAAREVAQAGAPALSADVLLLSAAKGLEDPTGLRVSQVLEEVIPEAAGRIAVISGPNLAVEVARGIPTAGVAASRNPDASQAVQRLFQAQPAFRVYTGRDVAGVELGGAIKNVIAIGAGVSDGLGFGDNSKAALMTRGLAEAIRL